MSRYFLIAVISIVLIVIQTTVISLISLEGITPDLLAIWVVYLALRKGQMPGTIIGFAVGLVFDMATGSFIGLSALTKTLCGFVAGYFYNENKTKLILGSYRFLLIMMVSSFVHNVVYFILFTRGTDIGVFAAIFQYGVTTTLYTSVLALIPLFVSSRRSTV
jgi:rod shape-determining protein MreD